MRLTASLSRPRIRCCSASHKCKNNNKDEGQACVRNIQVSNEFGLSSETGRRTRGPPVFCVVQAACTACRLYALHAFGLHQPACPSGNCSATNVGACIPSGTAPEQWGDLPGERS